MDLTAHPGNYAGTTSARWAAPPVYAEIPVNTLNFTPSATGQLPLAAAPQLPIGAAQLPAAPGLTPAVPTHRTVVTAAAPVTAMIVTRKRSPYLGATLSAVQAQTSTPSHIIIVDTDATPQTRPPLGLHFGTARYVPAAGAKTFGAAVDYALATGAVPPTEWLWLLHDDSAPEPDALAQLLSATEHSLAIGVAGCKQRQWQLNPAAQPGGRLSREQADRAAALISVGHSVTGTGQRWTGIDPGEIDQGQHDGRDDMLAVGLAGALVKQQLWRQLEGTDPVYGHFGDSTDFCQRAWRAGARVVVVPGAIVNHAQASLNGLRHDEAPRPSRKAHGAAQQIALTRGRAAAHPVATETSAAASYASRRLSQVCGQISYRTMLLLPLLLLFHLLKAPLMAVMRLMAKQPLEALAELLLPARLVWQTPNLVRAHRRLGRTTTLPQAQIRPLQATWADHYRAKREARNLAAVALRAPEYPVNFAVDPVSLGSGTVNLGTVNLGAANLGAANLGAGNLSHLNSMRENPTLRNTLSDNSQPDAIFPANLLTSAERSASARSQRRSLVVVSGLLVAVAAWLFGPWAHSLAAGYRLTGGALLAAPAPLSETWAQATAVSFAGGPVTPQPFLLVFAVLAGLARSGQVVVHLLMVLAIPMAGLAAWFAAGALTRSAWARTAAALAWGLAPALLGALAGGYLSAAVAHVVLPFAGLALFRALGWAATDASPLRVQLERKRLAQTMARNLEAGPRWGALAASAVLWAVVTASAPALWPLFLAIIGTWAVTQRGQRWLAPVLAAPSFVLSAPLWNLLAHQPNHWRLLLAPAVAVLPNSGIGESAISAGVFGAESVVHEAVGNGILANGAVDAWQLLFGHPSSPTGWLGTGAGLVAVLPWLPGLAVLLVAAVALFRRDIAGLARWAWLGAALAWAVAMLGATHGYWMGSAVSTLWLALGVAALAVSSRVGMGVSAQGRTNYFTNPGALAAISPNVISPDAISPNFTSPNDAGNRPPRHSLQGGILAGLVSVAALAAFGLWAHQNADGALLGELAATVAPVPAAADLLWASQPDGSLLHLAGPSGNDGEVITYALLRHNGSALTDLKFPDLTSSEVSQQALPATENTETDSISGIEETGIEQAGIEHGGSPIPQLVADLVSAPDVNLASALASQGIIGIVVPPLNHSATTEGNPANAQLAAQLDLQPGLTRMTEGDAGAVLWRVNADPSAANPTGGDPAAAEQIAANAISAEPTGGNPAGAANVNPNQNPGRTVWIGLLAATLGGYLLVAIPSPRTWLRERS